MSTVLLALATLTLSAQPSWGYCVIKWAFAYVTLRLAPDMLPGCQPSRSMRGGLRLTESSLSSERPLTSVVARHPLSPTLC